MQTPTNTNTNGHSYSIDEQMQEVIETADRHERLYNTIATQSFWKEQSRFILFGVVSFVCISGSLFGVLYYPTNCPLQNGLFSIMNFCLGSISATLLHKHKRKDK